MKSAQGVLTPASLLPAWAGITPQTLLWPRSPLVRVVSFGGSHLPSAQESRQERGRLRRLPLLPSARLCLDAARFSCCPCISPESRAASTRRAADKRKGSAFRLSPSHSQRWG